MSMFNALGVPEDEQIEHKMLTNAIEKAQKKIESNNFGIRKNLLEYDQVMNEQREIIYAERRRVLDGENMRDVIYKMITDIVENVVDMCIADDADPERVGFGRAESAAASDLFRCSRSRWTDAAEEVQQGGSEAVC